MGIESIGIYMLHNQETGEAYIGSGIINDRRNLHFRDLKNDKHINKKLQTSYNKNPNFEFVSCELENREEAFDLEQELIDTFKQSKLLLNISHNARVPINNHTEESKQKISISVSQAKQTEEFRDRTFNNEKWKKDLSEKVKVSSKRNWEDPEFKERMLNIERPGIKANAEIARQKREQISLEKKKDSNTSKTFGQERSEEFCINNSNKIKEKWQDPVYRENQLKAREGKMTSFKVPIIGDGVKYNSITEAASEMNITKEAISYRLKSNNFPEWYKINESQLCTSQIQYNNHE